MRLTVFASIAALLLICILPAPARAAISVVDYPVSKEVAPKKTLTFSQYCAAGEVMVSGGYAVTPTYPEPVTAERPSDKYFVFANYPSSTRTWQVGVSNRSTASVWLTIHIACARGLASASSTTSRLGSVGDELRAPCVKGMPTGGGFHIASGLASVDASLPFGTSGSTRGWLVKTSFVDGGSGGKVENFVVCNTQAKISYDRSSTLAVAQRELSVPGRTSQEFQCEGKVILGAGFEKKSSPAGDTLQLTRFSPRPTSRMLIWKAEAVALPSDHIIDPPPLMFVTKGTVTIYPVCVDDPPRPDFGEHSNPFLSHH